MSEQGKPPTLRAGLLFKDEKFGTMFVFQAAREWFEVRVTPSGLIRLGEAQKGAHPAMRDRARETPGFSEPP